MVSAIWMKGAMLSATLVGAVGESWKPWVRMVTLLKGLLASLTASVLKTRQSRATTVPDADSTSTPQ